MVEMGYLTLAQSDVSGSSEFDTNANTHAYCGPNAITDTHAKSDSGSPAAASGPVVFRYL